MSSLQTRLGVWLIISVVVLFGLHWLVTSRAPRNLTEEYVLSRLEHDGDSLLSGLRFDGDGRPILMPGHSAPVYDKPCSGHYYLIEAENHRARSPSLADEDLNLAGRPTGLVSTWRLTGPGGQPLLAWSAEFARQGRPVRITVAEDMTALQQHINQFRLRFTLVTLCLLAVLVIAQRFIIRVSLRPLEQLRDDCQRLDRGEVDTLTTNVPREILPLVEEINHLLGVMRQRMQRHRNALGNLAHALKTPLTLLSQTLSRLDPQVGVETATAMRDAIGKIRTIAERELKHARLAGTSVSASQRFDVARELPGLIDVLKKIYVEKRLAYEVSLPDTSSLSGDREDLLELFGNLLDNASKWAGSVVRITVAAGDGLTLRVEDDGPGVDEAEIERLLGRGERNDESSPGHGLGLAIVEDIVTQYGGELTLGRSEDLGGFRVDIRMPVTP
ncbi:MAG: sensor histidine kinase [Gammaproteobacteria bacterium]|nr:sensor histidine kinase [Gammaproteobacteria bacterium]